MAAESSRKVYFADSVKQFPFNRWYIFIGWFIHIFLLYEFVDKKRYYEYTFHWHVDIVMLYWYEIIIYIKWYHEDVCLWNVDISDGMST